MNVTVIGAGAWGTSFALHLAKTGHTVALFSRRLEHALEMASSRENARYLQGIALHPNIHVHGEIEPAIMEAEVIVFACPSKGLSEAAYWVAGALKRREEKELKGCLTLCKGMDLNVLECPGDIVARILPDVPVGVLSGPNNAAEIAKGLPAAAVIAFSSGNEVLLEKLQTAFSGPTFRLYRSTDRRGVELGGALKNIYAIGAGLCQGLSLGDNARAAFLTRALREMVMLGGVLGGEMETFYGLSGLGDLMATAHGDWSRNRTFGEAIGRGRDLEEVRSHSQGVVEGYWAIDAFHRKAQKEGILAPILDALHAVLYGDLKPMKAVEALMGRPVKSE